MASAKDTFESHSFRASTFACGAWRGSGVDVEIPATCFSAEYTCPPRLFDYTAPARIFDYDTSPRVLDFTSPSPR